MCTVLTKMEEFQQQMKAERERKSQAQKKWYIDNRERLNTKAKQYYQDNKQRLKKESQHIKQCPLCGTLFVLAHCLTIREHRNVWTCERFMRYIIL
jgi:predicted RNA-binding Zn-ribbon protein involved in translation (DUF1610 family)